MTKQSSGDTLPKLPGLLSDPKRILKEDDRVDPRILQVLEPFGLDGLPAEPPLAVQHLLKNSDRFALMLKVGSKVSLKPFFQTHSR